MASSRRHSRSSGRSQGRKTSRKLNVKLVVLILALPVLFVIAGVVVAVLLRGGEGIERLTRRRDPSYYQEKGDALMAEGEYDMAVRQYEAAAELDTSNSEAILRIVDALEMTKPDTPEKAAKNTSRMIGLLHRVTEMDSSNEAAQKRLLEMLYDGVLSLGQPRLAEQLLELAEKFHENHPERTYALKYKALAQAELVKRRDLTELERKNARDDLKKALQLFPDDPALLSGLSMWNAMEAARLKDHGGVASVEVTRLQEESETILRESLSKAPQNLVSKLQLARTLFAHDKKAEALATLGELEQVLIQTPDPELSTQTANFLAAADTETVATRQGAIATGGLVRADKILQAAVDLYPDDLKVLFSLATVKKRIGEQEEAIALLRKAMTIDPRASVGVGAMAERQLKFAATTELANIYLVMAEREPDPEARKSHIEECRSLMAVIGQEMSSSALVDLLDGKIALLSGNLAKAVTKFETADRKFGGRNPEAVFLSAIALQRSGEVGAAIERLERLADSDLGDEIDVRTGKELAKLYLRAGQTDKAMRKIDEVLEIATDDQAALLIKSEILSRTERVGDTAGAGGVQGLDQAIRLLKPLAGSGDIRATVQLARIYRDNDRPEEARSLLAAAMEVEPNNMVLLQQLVQLDVQLDDKEKAVERLDAAVARAPDNQLLKLLRQQLTGGEQTVEMIEKMLTETEDPFQSAMGLYTLYRNTDRVAAARAQLEKAAELRPDDEKVLTAQFQEAVQARDWKAAQQVCDRVASLDLDQARGAFWQGRLEMARQRYVRAASSFEAGIKKRPLYSHGWRMLGDSHRLAGSYVEAENAYQEAIRLKPDNLRALYNLFLVHDLRGQRQSAMADLERARELAPDDPVISNAYLNYLGQEKPGEALQRRLDKMEDSPEDVRNRIEVAKLLQETGEGNRAGEIYRQLLDEFPDNRLVVLSVAEFQRDQGNVHKGREILQGFVDRLEEKVKLEDWLVLARFLISCDLSQPAVAAYEEAILLEDPVEREASRELGDWYFNNQFFAKALPLYQKAYESRKDSPRLTLRYIETLIYNNMPEKAEPILSKYVAVNGETPQTALLQCIIAIETKEFDKASDFAETAVKLGPSNPQAYLYRARLNFLKAGKTGTKRHVVRDLEKSLSLDSTMLAAREMLVDCYLGQQPPELHKAVSQLEAMVEQKPESPQARIRLIQLLLDTGKTAEAREQIAAGAEIMPRIPAWYSLRADLLKKQGKHQEALADLKKLFEVSKNSSSLSRLAIGCVAAGRAEEALKLLEGFPEELNNDPMLMAAKGRAELATGNKNLAANSFEIAYKRAVEDPTVLNRMLRMGPELMPTSDFVTVLDKVAPMDRTGMVKLAAGQLLLDEGRLADGVRRLENLRGEMPKSNPTLPRMLHLLANAYQKMNDYRSAAGVYRELTVLAPQDFVAFNNLSYILCEHLGEADEAVEVGVKALDLVPNEEEQKSNVLDTLGWAYFKSGNLDKARVHLVESVRYQAGLHNQLHLAKVLIDKQLRPDARLQLRNLLRTAREQGNAEFAREAEQLLRTL